MQALYGTSVRRREPPRRKPLKRRRRGRTLPIVTGVVLVGLAVAAVVQIGARSGVFWRNVDRSYGALVDAEVAQSNVTGALADKVLSDGPSLDRGAFFADVEALSTRAIREEKRLQEATPPAPSGRVATWCQSTFDLRAQGAKVMDDALEGVLGGRTGRQFLTVSDAVDSMQQASSEITTADADWRNCRGALARQRGHARVVASQWTKDPALWSAPTLATFVTVVSESPGLAPVHELSIAAVSTDPPAVNPSGVGVIAPTSSIVVHVSVSNKGNVDEPQTLVSVEADPQGHGSSTPVSVQALSAVAARSSVEVDLPSLPVTPGDDYQLVVSASFGSGSKPAATLSLPVHVSKTPTSPG